MAYKNITKKRINDKKRRQTDKRKQYMKEWRLKNKEKIQNQERKRSQTDKRKQYIKEWRLKNKEKIQKYYKIWTIMQKDGNKVKLTDEEKRIKRCYYANQQYKKNKKAFKARTKNWIEKNKEQYKAMLTEWRKENPDYHKKWYRKNKEKVLMEAARKYQDKIASEAKLKSLLILRLGA